MRKTTPLQIRPGAVPRQGSTLSEVLISLLVLAVGVVSVATLFPLSVLRAVRANQFTQATVLRYNAEAAVRTLQLNRKDQFFGADRGPGYHEDTNLNGFLDAGEDRNGNGVLDGDDDLDGYLDIIGFHPGPNGTPNDGDDYPLYDIDELFAQNTDDVHNVLIDPIGFHRMNDLGGNWRNSFNNQTPIVLRRVSGGHRANNNNSGIGFHFNLAQAERVATLPDQYSTMLDTTVASATASGTPLRINQVTLPNNLDPNTGTELAAIVKGGGLANITVFANGEAYACRILAEDTNNNGTLDDPPEDINGNGQLDETDGLDLYFDPPLPATVGTGDVERVIVQNLLKDFTWMISARLEDNTLAPDMDVIVFSKREFDQRDERLYDATLVDSDPGVFYSNFNVVRMNFSSGNRPFAKPGGWMFDAENNYWYRVQSIRRETPTSLELLVDRSILDFDGDNAIKAAFLRGIVEVYPIGRQE